MSPSEYVSSVLQLNPVEQAAAILRRRNCFLGMVPAEPAQPDESRAQMWRDNLQNQINAVRQDFWTAPLEQLQQTLASLDAHKFPDLEVTVRRLRQLASVRDEFPRLAAHKHANQLLFDAFTHVVVLSPREAGIAKERTLQALIAEHQISRAKKMVKMLKSKFPHLYQLEPNWFHQVSRLRKKAGGIQVSNKVEGLTIPGWAIWVMFLIIVKVLAVLARMSQ
jgi:hypothetical protein